MSAKPPPLSAKPVNWRYADTPRTGTIFRLPDDVRLQRGITYTYLPDGRSMRLPSMNRLLVRASAASHQESENHDIVQALQKIIQGKRPTAGSSRFDHMGRAHVPGMGRREGNAQPRRGPPARNQVRGDGLRGIPIEA